MSDFTPDPEEQDESRGVPHFLTDIGRLVNRYSFEYDMSDAEILGCLDITKQMFLAEITRQANEAYMEDEEKKPKEDQEDEDPGIDYEL